VSTDLPPEHRHPELERMIAERYRLLHEVMVMGFADLVRELREGFGRVNQRFDQVEQRLDGHDQRFAAIEARLDAIEAHLREPGQDGA